MADQQFTLGEKREWVSASRRALASVLAAAARSSGSLAARSLAAAPEHGWRGEPLERRYESSLEHWSNLGIAKGESVAWLNLRYPRLQVARAICAAYLAGLGVRGRQLQGAIQEIAREAPDFAGATVRVSEYGTVAVRKKEPDSPAGELVTRSVAHLPHGSLWPPNYILDLDRVQEFIDDHRHELRQDAR